MSYRALHKYLERVLGVPKKCEMCGITSAKRFEWANKRHEEYGKKDDYIRLCVCCHRKYDFTDDKKSKAVKNLIWNSGKPHPTAIHVNQVSLDGEFIAQWPSISAASKATGANITNIWYCVNGKRKTCGGFIWKRC